MCEIWVGWFGDWAYEHVFHLVFKAGHAEKIQTPNHALKQQDINKQFVTK